MNRNEFEKKPGDVKFVNSLAWVLMGFFAYSFINSLVQLVVFSRVPPMEFLNRHFSGSDIYIRDVLPPLVKTLLNDHYMGLTLLSIILSLVFFFPALALLKRKNWARIFWIIIMLLSIVAGILPLFFSQYFTPEFPPEISNPAINAAISRIVYIGLVAMAVIFTLFHGWIARKLLSKEISKQFIQTKISESLQS